MAGRSAYGANRIKMCKLTELLRWSNVSGSLNGGGRSWFYLMFVVLVKVMQLRRAAVCLQCMQDLTITLLLYNQQPKSVTDISDTLTQINKKNVKWSSYRPGAVQRVGRGIALLFHDRGTGKWWVVSSTPRPHFTLWKDPVPIAQEAGWATGPVWTGGKSCPHRDSIPDRPARSSVAIPTELPGPWHKII